MRPSLLKVFRLEAGNLPQPNDYILEIFVDLVESHCTGYARPRETPAS
jgi:hypothetical protein